MSSINIIALNWGEAESSARTIRECVFIEEQKVPVECEWEQADLTATHFLAYWTDHSTTNDSHEHEHEHILVGNARLLPDGQIGRMAVLPQWRHRGAGSALLIACEQHAAQQSLTEVFLHAQQHARGFYERVNYNAEGHEFIDAGITHISMRKKFRQQFEQ